MSAAHDVLQPNRPSRICFFVGPTLTSTDIHAAFAGTGVEVLVLPPIQQGDLLRLFEDPPDVVGIIDGYFFQVPAVLHKEILVTMKRGIRVLGAASIGALRAAELDSFGMEGIGRIYHLYKQGRVDGDDEVAILHTEAEDGFRSLTEPLVNIRLNIERARSQGIISKRTVAAVLASAKRLHFSQRTYQTVLAEARCEAARPAELEELRLFLRNETIDWKREDALTLVRTVAARVAGARSWPSAVAQKQVRTTLYLHLYQREYVGHTIDGMHLPNTLVLSLQKLLSPTFAKLFRRVMLRCLALDEALHRGLRPKDRDTLITQFRCKQELQSDQAFDTWLHERYMSHNELEASLRERDLEKQILTLYKKQYTNVRGSEGQAAAQRRLIINVMARTGMGERELTCPALMRPGIPWEPPLLRELKFRGQFNACLLLARSVLRYHADISRYLPAFSAALSHSRLEQWIADMWAVNVADLDTAATDRGFTSYYELIETTRLAYAYCKSREVQRI